MSGTANQQQWDLSRFDRMSTQELQTIIANDFSVEPQHRLHSDVILYILEVITKRKAEDPNAEPLDIEADWRSFQENYMPYASRKSLWDDDFDYDDGEEDAAEAEAAKAPQKPRRFRALPEWIRTTASVAAVLVVLFTGTMTAKAFGFDVWDRIMSWTEDVFNTKFSTTPQATPKTAELQKLLDEYGISKISVPTYLPYGYESAEHCVNEYPALTEIFGEYYCEDSSICISFVKYSDFSHAGMQCQKDLENPVIYSHEGIDFYIMTNFGKYKTIWSYDNIEGNISGVNSEDEMIKMIQSIGVIE